MRIHRISGLMAYSYLIETAEALFLVDGGMAGTGRNILKRIAQIGRKPEELKFAIVTHAHADHFGGLAVVQAASDCAIICHPSHAETVRRGRGIVSPGLTVFGKIYERIAKLTLPTLTLPSLSRVVTVEDGTELHTPRSAGQHPVHARAQLRRPQPRARRRLRVRRRPRAGPAHPADHAAGVLDHGGRRARDVRELAHAARVGRHGRSIRVTAPSSASTRSSRSSGAPPPAGPVVGTRPADAVQPREPRSSLAGLGLGLLGRAAAVEPPPAARPRCRRPSRR